MKSDKSKEKKAKKPLPFLLVLLLDGLMIGVILIVFAFYHHVYPKYLGDTQLEIEQALPVESTAEEATEETMPVNRMEFLDKFRDHFTDEVILTENSYSSPEVSITIDTVSAEIDGYATTYYVADVYIAGMANFGACIANNRFTNWGGQDIEVMTANANAILAMNGDFATAQVSGFIVRDGQTYLSDLNNGICVMYADGTMATYDRGTYEVEDILAQEPLHVWSFGPSLLDDSGKARTEFEHVVGISEIHPRAAIGYYEPGHYCFVVVDGRQAHSVGISLESLAVIFEELGCALAYNLDGGGSAIMMYDSQRYSISCDPDRDIGDILYITDAYYNAGEESQ